ncbi:unnamed protein product [Symbiodinium sp. CCMP2592]|nr:unnamed protein product [Symbiodinium sp. CCMP2592]
MRSRSVVAHSMCRMLRPELVAIILGFCGCENADCSEGTCQVLSPYFDCEYDQTGAAGGGNTIAPAHCREHATDVVVRASFELPQSYANDSQQKFFYRVDALNGLNGRVPQTREEWFLLRGLGYGLLHDHRDFDAGSQRRSFSWNTVGEMRLVFEVASPAATCELCMRNLSLPLYSVSENDFDELGTVSRFTTHFSIMQQVRPVDLNRLTLEDMLLFVVGYVQDLTTFAHAHLWHDCHTGNLLQSRLQGGTFYWHDFAGSSFETSTPSSQVLEEFIKINGTLEALELAAERLHAKSLAIPSLAIQRCDTIDANLVETRLRKFNADLQRHVMRLTVDVELRKSVLRALGKVLSSERHEELQLELMKSSAAPAQPIVIWACQLRKDGSTN